MLAAIKGKLGTMMNGDPLLHKMLQCLALSFRDSCKVSTHLLTSIIQLRRDAVLLHCPSSRAMRDLRHATIESQTELFSRQVLDKAEEEQSKNIRELALVSAARTEERRQSRQPKKRKSSRPSTPSQTQPKRARSQTSGSASGGAKPQQTRPNR